MKRTLGGASTGEAAPALLGHVQGSGVVHDAVFIQAPMQAVAAASQQFTGSDAAGALFVLH